MKQVQIFSEFQKLEEVIVGRAHPTSSFDYIEDVDYRSAMARVMDETEEDLQTLCGMLESFGVTVRRPEIPFSLGHDKKTHQFDLQSFSFQFPNHPLMPRDTVLIAGNTIVETFTRSQNRFFENWSYAGLFSNYFREGANWISLPMPQLEDKNKSYGEYTETNPLYHAANFLKCGRDIFYSQPHSQEWKGKGTQIGVEWFKRNLGNEFRFSPAPCAGHLDGKMALLRPGVVATWNPKFLPEKLKSWDCVVIPDKPPLPEAFQNLKKQRFYKDFVTEWLNSWIGYVDETVFDVNMFSVSENLVITNGHNPEVYAAFKQRGIEAVPWNFRHQYFWDGAIHCVTLDVRRAGEQEDYFA